jgi:ABC-type branched-subunit amino acid transport system substrate-binding protein
MGKLTVYASMLYVVYLVFRALTSGPVETPAHMRNAQVAQNNVLEIAVVWPKRAGQQHSLDGYVYGIETQIARLNEARQVICGQQPLQTQAPSQEQAQTQEQAATQPQESAAKETLELAKQAKEPTSQAVTPAAIGCSVPQIKVSYYAEELGSRNDSVAQAKLIADNKNLVSVLGYHESISAIPASIVYENEGILMLISGATNARLTHYDFDYIFRHINNDATNATEIAEHIYQQGYANVSVLYERGIYGDDFSGYLTEAAVNRGLRIPNVITYETGKLDHTAKLMKLRQNIKPVSKREELALSYARLEQLSQVAKVVDIIKRFNAVPKTKEGPNTLTDSTLTDKTLADRSEADQKDILDLLEGTDSNKETNRTSFAALDDERLLAYLRIDLDFKSAPSMQRTLLDGFRKSQALLDEIQIEQKLNEMNQRLEKRMNEFNLKYDKDLKSTSDSSQDIQLKKILTAQINELNISLNRLKRINDNTTDIIFLAGGMPGIGKIIVQSRKLGIKLPFIGGDSFLGLSNVFHCPDVDAIATPNMTNKNSSDTRCQALGQFYRFTMKPKLSRDQNQPIQCKSSQKAKQKLQQFTNAYKKHHNNLEPNEWAIQGYLAVSILNAALVESGSTKPGVLSDIIRYAGTDLNERHGLVFHCNDIYNASGDVFINPSRYKLPKKTATLATHKGKTQQ